MQRGIRAHGRSVSPLSRLSSAEIQTGGIAEVPAVTRAAEVGPSLDLPMALTAAKDDHQAHESTAPGPQRLNPHGGVNPGTRALSPRTAPLLTTYGRLVVSRPGIPSDCRERRNDGSQTPRVERRQPDLLVLVVFVGRVV